MKEGRQEGRTDGTKERKTKKEETKKQRRQTKETQTRALMKKERKAGKKIVKEGK